jgi:hypothetical protein
MTSWYTNFIHGICYTYTRFSVIFKICKLSKQQSMLDGLEIHVSSIEFQDNYWVALKKHDLMSDRIYQVYTRYIPGIYHVYTIHIPCEGHLWACLVAHARFAASDQEFPRIFSVFGHTEAAHARLGPFKFPQPGVDLVNMSAPQQVRACTFCTAALKSVLLLAAVLVWNS